MSRLVRPWYSQRQSVDMAQHRACSSRRDRDALPAMHIWAAWRAPSASAGWGGVVSRGWHSVCSTRRDRNATPAARTCATLLALRVCQRLLRRVATSRGWHRACSTRRDRDAPLAAHTWAALHAPSISAGWGDDNYLLIPRKGHQQSGMQLI
jgi:hypothetical protein